tara:strand:- start:1024 stop:1959 length:936 start_codon:yes stop_codon:yes gene_type:complete
MKLVTVTGGAGYIGCVLVEKLLLAGYCVRVIDNFMYQEGTLNHLIHNSDLEIIRVDQRDTDRVLSAIDGSDFLVPLAAVVGAPACQEFPAQAEAINKKSLQNLFHLADKQLRIIMPTTNSAYGNGHGKRFCSETSPLNPISSYAIEKVAVEQNLLDRGNSCSLRLATVFGMSPRMRFDLLVNDFVRRAMRDGFLVLFEAHYKRNYIHVRDVASAIIHSMDNWSFFKGEIFNVGLSEANVSKFELAQKIQTHVPGLVIHINEFKKDPDQRDYLVSNRKIESLGWVPDYSLDEGIKEVIRGLSSYRYFSHGNL